MPLPSLEDTFRKYNGICHYCKQLTIHSSIGLQRKKKGKQESRFATREHIVPKHFGGTNKSSNITLACHDCNNKRGNQLFYCKCSRCSFLINKALRSNFYIKRNFDAMLSFNKVKISKTTLGRWEVKQGNGQWYFDKFEDAVARANDRLSIDPRAKIKR